MSKDLWQQLCAASDRYPTCTIRLHQQQGWIRGFTIEHGPVLDDRLATDLPPHIAQDMPRLTPAQKGR
jgi:hypothetical protein